MGWLWEVFTDLSSARRAGMSGPEPIAYSEMWAWSQLYGHEFSPWDIDTLRSLDSAWLKAISDGNSSGTRSKNQRGRGKKG
jgi:hypothetical protein